MKPFSFRRSTSHGFTLIETLVVMVISVGLVVIVALLFRSVGHAAVALKGGNPEWSVQTLLREQLAHGLKPADHVWLSGDGAELSFLTWKSRSSGLDGKPVIVQYQYNPGTRALTYREASLPPWWGSTPLPSLSQLQSELKLVAPVNLMNAVDSLDFRFVPPEAVDLEPATWGTSWRQEVPPKLIVLRFSRNRDYTVWLDLSSTTAS